MWLRNHEKSGNGLGVPSGQPQREVDGRTENTSKVGDRSIACSFKCGADFSAIKWLRLNEACRGQNDRPSFFS